MNPKSIEVLFGQLVDKTFGDMSCLPTSHSGGQCRIGVYIPWDVGHPVHHHLLMWVVRGRGGKNASSILVLLSAVTTHTIYYVCSVPKPTIQLFCVYVRIMLCVCVCVVD